MDDTLRILARSGLSRMQTLLLGALSVSYSTMAFPLCVTKRMISFAVILVGLGVLHKIGSSSVL